MSTAVSDLVGEELGSPENKKIGLERYEKLEKLGEGTYGMNSL